MTEQQHADTEVLFDFFDDRLTERETLARHAVQGDWSPRPATQGHDGFDVVAYRDDDRTQLDVACCVSPTPSKVAVAAMSPVMTLVQTMPPFMPASYGR